MRFLKYGVIGALGAIMIVPAAGWATSHSEPPALSAVVPSIADLAGTGFTAPVRSAAPLILIADESSQGGSSGSARPAGEFRQSFNKFGHAVKDSAKDVGHAVGDGAHEAGRGLSAGWDSFKRVFTGK